jgi:hypothetical protein
VFALLNRVGCGLVTNTLDDQNILACAFPEKTFNDNDNVVDLTFPCNHGIV